MKTIQNVIKLFDRKLKEDPNLDLEITCCGDDIEKNLYRLLRFSFESRSFSPFTGFMNATETIKDVVTLNDYPTKIVVSKMYLRILMTDIDGYKTEKIIIFEVPLNSQAKKESYAKL